GGRAASDSPSGFVLNRGVHALYTGGAASSVLSELGVQYTHGSPGHAFVRDAGGLQPFPASLTDMVRTNLLSAADKREMLGVFLRLGLLKSERLADQSVADWIASVTRRPMIRRLLTSSANVSLYTTALDLASADVLVARLQQSFRHPIHYVEGGWQHLVDALRGAATSAGVEIQTSASVEAVEVDKGSASGVRLHDGRHVAATSVVLAGTPEDARRLVPAATAPHLHSALADCVPVHVACLDLALSRLPAPQHPVVFDLEQPLFMTVQSEFARLAPEAGAVLHAVMQLDPRRPAQPLEARARLEAFVDDVQPGWQALAVERRFLPHLLAVGSLPLATSHGLQGRLPHHSPDVDNLYFAGDWVGPRGYLIDAGLASARESAQQILRGGVLAPVLRAA
ncbi:MAG: NAD(P)/FAD-dependent oxidoreductase, partial [Chloroflexi bacterium]|nr:NAD(P)/FAD-dependent oxidoreductase [Chloroflexota bacterium]